MQTCIWRAWASCPACWQYSGSFCNYYRWSSHVSDTMTRSLIYSEVPMLWQPIHLLQEMGWNISQAERHFQKFVFGTGDNKGCFADGVFRNWDMINPLARSRVVRYFEWLTWTRSSFILGMGLCHLVEVSVVHTKHHTSISFVYWNHWRPGTCGWSPDDMVVQKFLDLCLDAVLPSVWYQWQRASIGTVVEMKCQMLMCAAATESTEH